MPTAVAAAAAGEGGRTERKLLLPNLPLTPARGRETTEMEGSEHNKKLRKTLTAVDIYFAILEEGLDPVQLHEKISPATLRLFAKATAAGMLLQRTKLEECGMIHTLPDADPPQLPFVIHEFPAVEPWRLDTMKTFLN